MYKHLVISIFNNRGLPFLNLPINLLPNYTSIEKKEKKYIGNANGMSLIEETREVFRKSKILKSSIISISEH